MKVRYLLLLIIVMIILMVWIFSERSQTPNEFYDQAVARISSDSYEGIVIDKYYDKNNRGRNKIILEQQGGMIMEFDFVYEKKDPYHLISIGDSLIKATNSLNLRIVSEERDTTVVLKLDNLKKE